MRIPTTRRSTAARAAALVVALLALLALTGQSSYAAARPKVIPLPAGFQPEGIAVQGKTFYVGSIPTGAIFRGDLRMGEGSVVVPAQQRA